MNEKELKSSWPPSKELLNQFIKEKKTNRQIVKLFNKSTSTIRKYLPRYSIYRETIATPEYLYTKYVIEGLTFEEIGKLIKRNIKTVRYYFKKYKNKGRS